MATAFPQVKNGAYSTIQAGSTVIGSAIGTSVTVGSGHGARFPNPGNGFWATVWNAATYANPNLDPNSEIMWVSARSTDTLTVVRGQVNTTAATTIAAGYAIQALVLDQHFTVIHTAINALEAGGAFPQLNDSNGNKAIQITPATTPVNFIDVANAATTVTPAITGTGTDTNVGLNLKTKGSGMLYENGISFPTYRSEQLPGNFVASGMAMGTNGGLSVHYNAGVAYIGGVRYTYAQTNVTLVASADNYIDINASGVVVQSNVAPGSTPPTLVSGGLRLSKTTTNTTDPTSFTESGSWDSLGNPFHPLSGNPQVIGRAFSTGGSTVVAAASAGTATDITNMSATFNKLQSGLIEVIFSLPIVQTVSTDVFGVRLMEGSTQLSIVQNTAGNTTDNSVLGHFFLTATAGSHTYKLTIRREAGSGGMTADVGPNFPQSLIIRNAY